MKKSALIILSLIIVTTTHLYAKWVACGFQGNTVYAHGGNQTVMFAAPLDSNIYLSLQWGPPWMPQNNGLPVLDTNCYISSFTIAGTYVFAATSGINASGIYMSKDTGARWTAVNNGLTNHNVLSMAFCSTYIFAGTQGSGVFVSADSGKNWTAPSSSSITNTVVTTIIVDNSFIYAGTEGTGIFKTMDFGTTWTQVNNGLTNMNITSIAVRDDVLFAGTNGSGIFRSYDQGASWQAANNFLPNLSITKLVAPDNGYKYNVIFAAMEGGGLYYSMDLGTSWQKQSNDGLPNKEITTMNIIKQIGRYHLYVGVENSGLYLSPIQEAMSLSKNTGSKFSSIYPNPSCNETTIQTQKTINGNATLYVYNATGQIVAKINNITGQSFIFNHQHLPAGQYVLKLTENNIVLNEGNLIIAK